jgi:hypothetical protein
MDVDTEITSLEDVKAVLEWYFDPLSLHMLCSYLGDEFYDILHGHFEKYPGSRRRFLFDFVIEHDFKPMLEGLWYSISYEQSGAFIKWIMPRVVIHNKLWMAKWLLGNGCFWNPLYMKMAQKYKHDEMVAWFWQNGYFPENYNKGQVTTMGIGSVTGEPEWKKRQRKKTG